MPTKQHKDDILYKNIEVDTTFRDSAIASTLILLFIGCFAYFIF